MARAAKAAVSASDFGARIARLDLKPGETLVATLDASIATPENCDALRDYIAAALPAGVKLLVVDDRVTFSIVSSAAA